MILWLNMLGRWIDSKQQGLGTFDLAANVWSNRMETSILSSSLQQTKVAFGGT